MEEIAAAERERARAAEREFHLTAQRNAIGGYIGCDGPDCWELIQQITRDSTGHRIQGVR